MRVLIEGNTKKRKLYPINAPKGTTVISFQRINTWIKRHALAHESNQPHQCRGALQLHGLDHFEGQGDQQGDDAELIGRLSMKRTDIFINFFTKPDNIPLEIAL